MALGTARWADGAAKILLMQVDRKMQMKAAHFGYLGVVVKCKAS